MRFSFTILVLRDTYYGNNIVRLSRRKHDTNEITENKGSAEEWESMVLRMTYIEMIKRNKRGREREGGRERERDETIKN